MSVPTITPTVRVRTVHRVRHPDAVEEACRRLKVMHEKWPEKHWRMEIRSEVHPVVGRWQVWAIYAVLGD